MNKLEISSIPFLHRSLSDAGDLRWITGALPIVGIVLPRLSFVLATAFKLQHIVQEWRELNANHQNSVFDATKLALTQIANAVLVIGIFSLVWMGQALGIQLALALNLFESANTTKNALLSGQWSTAFYAVLNLAASAVQFAASLTTNGLYLMVSAQLALCLADMYQSLMEITVGSWYEGICLAIAAALRFNAVLPAASKVARRITHSAADQAAIDKILGQHKASKATETLDLDRALKRNGYSDQLHNISLLNETSCLEVNGLEFELCDLRNTTMTGIHDSNFADCLCCNMSLSQADVIDSSFKECSLVGLNSYNTTFRGCQFYACNAADADFTNAAFFATTISYSNLNGANLSCSRSTNTTLKHCDLKDVYAAHSQIIDSQFTNCNLDDSNWFNSSWNHCELTFCVGNNVECVNAVLTHTKIRNSTLPNALLSGGVLIKSSFEKSNLTQALFAPVLVKDSYLQDCVLKNVVGDLAEAELINCQPTHDNSLRVGCSWLPDVAGASNSRIVEILRAQGIQVVKISTAPPLDVDCPSLQAEWQPELEQIQQKALAIKDSITNWKTPILNRLKARTEHLTAQLHGIVIADGPATHINLSPAEEPIKNMFCNDEYRHLLEQLLIDNAYNNSKPGLAVGASGITSVAGYAGGTVTSIGNIEAPQIRELKLTGQQKISLPLCRDFTATGLGKELPVSNATDGRPAIINLKTVTALGFNPEMLAHTRAWAPSFGCDPTIETDRCHSIATQLLKQPTSVAFCKEIWSKFTKSCSLSAITPLQATSKELSAAQISEIVTKLPESVAKAFRGCTPEELRNQQWHAKIAQRL